MKYIFFLLWFLYRETVETVQYQAGISLNFKTMKKPLEYLKVLFVYKNCVCKIVCLYIFS